MISVFLQQAARKEAYSILQYRINYFFLLLFSYLLYFATERLRSLQKLEQQGGGSPIKKQETYNRYHRLVFNRSNDRKIIKCCYRTYKPKKKFVVFFTVTVI